MSDMEPIDIQLPAGWVTTSLGDLCDLYQPKTISSKEMVIDGAYPVFGANGIIGRYSEYNHEESEVLLSCRGNVGTVNISVAKAWITGNSMVCSPKDRRITKACLAHLLDSADLRAAITGTAQQQITRRSLSPIVVSLPPLAEQEKIVEILEEQLSRLDAALESVRVMREKAAQFRRSLLHAAFTGTLTGHNPTDGQLPEGWRVDRLDSVASVQLGRSRSPKNHTGPNMRPYLRAANVTWSGLYLSDISEMNFTDEEMDIYRLIDGDILVNEASGSPTEVGKAVLFRGEINDCGFQNHLIRIRTSGARNSFILHFLTYNAISGAYVSQSRGVGINHLGKAKLAAWPTPIPTPTEQDRIVEILEEQLSRLDAALAVADAIEKRSADLRRSLLHAAFTGRLTEKWRESAHV